MIYNLDFVRLGIYLVPFMLRKPKTLAFLKSITKPIRTLKSNFDLYRETTLFDLQINSQVVKLEQALNHYFDNELNRIYIEDNDASVEQKYIFTEVEHKPLFLNTVYIGTPDESVGKGVDFIVYIPTDIDYKYEEYRIKAVLNKNKLAGTRYKIEQI